MKDEKDSLKFPTVGCLATAIFGTIFIVLAIIELCKGASAAIEDGLGTWLLVTGGLALFAFLVSMARKNG